MLFLVNCNGGIGMKKNNLKISNFQAAVEDKSILHGVTITVSPGEVHAVMGPNGSGKSTLAYALMGHPSYTVDPASQCFLDGKNILELSPDERARAGLFLAFQSPIAIPGITVVNLLRTAYQEIHGEKKQTQEVAQNPVLQRRWQAGGMSIQEFTKRMKEYGKELAMNDNFFTRSIHDGFSGGEKKKLEMLQALVLAPKFAIFDEIDTGLDVDALKVVAHGIDMLTKQGTGVIVITHYQRILQYLKPDAVHVLVKGSIVKSGKAALAKKIEKNGYSAYLT